MEVAAEGTNGKDKASRVKAAQGLLLNRIQRKSGKKAVVQRDYFTAPVSPGLAESCLAFSQMAVAEAGLAGDRFSFIFAVQVSFTSIYSNGLLKGRLKRQVTNQEYLQKYRPCALLARTQIRKSGRRSGGLVQIPPMVKD